MDPEVRVRKCLVCEEFETQDQKAQHCIYCGAVLDEILTEAEILEQAEQAKREDAEAELAEEREEQRLLDSRETARLARREEERLYQKVHDERCQELRDEMSQVSVAMNGGSEVMESAVVPIQTFFSEAIGAKKPTHVFIIDRNEDEQAESVGRNQSGRRMIYSIKDSSGSLEFVRSGNHYLEIYLIATKKSRYKSIKKIEKELLTKSGVFYQFGITPESVVSHQSSGYCSDFTLDSIVGFHTQEVSIPKELLAKKPRTGFALAFWEWVNHWYDQTPRDECHYKKRVVPAILVWPIVWLVIKMFLILWAMASTVFALVVFICGFKLHNIGTMIKDTYQNTLNFEDHSKNVDYRVWKYEERSFGGYRAVSYIPVTIIEVFLVVLGLYLWLFKVNYGANSVDFYVVLILSSVFMIGTLFSWADRLVGKRVRKLYSRFGDFSASIIDRISAKRKAARLAKRQLEYDELHQQGDPLPEAEEEVDEYRHFLGHFTLDKKPERIVISEIPSAYGGVLKKGKQRIVLRVRAYKAGHCRPYEE